VKLGVKKKDKEDKEKDKKKDKDKGYAALEGESSPDESEMEVKSPFKGKKRSFKFASRKEKKKDEEKEKKKDKKKYCEASPKPSREESKMEKAEKKKDKKDKDKDKDKEKELKVKEKEAKSKDKEMKMKDKEKEKETKGKEIKNKLKIKDKKKVKPQEIPEDDLPVFGVPLEMAVKRSHCHDGVDLPVIVRNCIDYIEEFGLQHEGIYRSSGVKTRVTELRRAYNNRENVVLKDVEPPIVASLLKQFLRELPEHILTNDLVPKFEEASGIKDQQHQEEVFLSLIKQLPPLNKLLLSWLMVHIDHVIEKEKYNKMNVQNLSIVFCPTLNFTHRLLSIFFTHGRSLFAGTRITKYIPPLSGFGVSFPEDFEGMAVELRKQESLLAQIHSEMSFGSVVKHREEQLWEAQHIVTQLKRKLRHQPVTASLPVKAEKVVQTLPEDAPSVEPQDELRLELALPQSQPQSSPEDVEPIPIVEPPKEAVDSEISESGSPTETSHHVTTIEVGSQEDVTEPPIKTVAVLDSEQELELLLKTENLERETLIEQLQKAIEKERGSVERLQELLAETISTWADSSEEDETTESGEEEQQQVLAEIFRENRQLEEQNVVLQTQIEEAREACLQFRVQLRVHEEKIQLGVVSI